MISQLSAYALAMVLGVIAAIIAAFAYLYHRREFWKIAEWERLRIDQTTLDALGQKMQEMQTSLARVANEVSDAEETIRRAGVERVFLDQQPQLEADRLALLNGLADVAERTRKAVEDLNAAAQRRNDIETEIASTRELHGKLKSQIAEMEASLGDLQKQVEELQKQVVALTAEKNRLDGDIERLKAEKLRLDEELKALQPKVQEAKDLAAKVDGLKGQEKTLTETAEQLTKTIDVLTKQMENMGPSKPEERYQDLWKTLNFPALPTDVQPSTEQATFLRMSRYVTGDLRLKFPDRVLLAFHTALKCSDISPIAVLAGISGTGKSLLPKCYAEGMGMHFVSLPVQPRWDSPQDLFGFYNYLEKRYKATDLARAMVQFEKYNRTKWPMPPDWDGAREDRMLLVLLDEMNLARIEYYFSDFLSKLETRREIRDRGSESERAKAEIALDMGSLGKTEAAIRLFPDENVLFTGTMNEDETTQTLSDKVLDRACVLRFGKPNRVEEYKERTDARPRTEGLAYATWQQWRKKPSSLGAQLHDINGWVDGLNTFMNKLGRPFGHRVILAMQTYIANYPSWADPQERINWAKADQIEQRIMPKLRGLDVDAHQEALDGIQQLVDGLGDRDLGQAFRLGRQDRTVFVWQGLDRSTEVR